MTTIKVSKPVRERLARAAAERGITAGMLLEEFLDRYERQKRLASVGRAYAAEPDPGYIADTEAWDAALSDGGPW